MFNFTVSSQAFSGYICIWWRGINIASSKATKLLTLLTFNFYLQERDSTSWAVRPPTKCQVEISREMAVLGFLSPSGGQTRRATEIRYPAVFTFRWFQLSSSFSSSFPSSLSPFLRINPARFLTTFGFGFGIQFLIRLLFSLFILRKQYLMGSLLFFKSFFKSSSL